MPNGYFSFLLHAHLPFVRHPEDEHFIEELWFYEALAETYLPCLDRLYRLAEMGCRFPITISLSPTLLAMMTDSLLKQRFLRYLDQRIILAEKELVRNSSSPSLRDLARFYLDYYTRIRIGYDDRFHQDLIEPFRQLHSEGKIELWTTSATHCYLPLFQHQPNLINAQIRIGIESFRHCFGFDPDGFWLPECGYFTDLDQILHSFGVSCTVLETHSLLFGNPRPLSGVYLPVCSPANLTVFARDLVVAQQIWSGETGYPGDADYRDFYSDIGYDLSLTQLEPAVHPAGFRTSTGIKYHRITNKRTASKQLYHPESALLKVRQHSWDFMAKIRHQIEKLSGMIGTPPLITAPFDAELYGHWWFEGVDFLFELAQLVAAHQPGFEFMTFNSYREKFPPIQHCNPSPSSWGKNGYSEMWLNNTNDWIYPPLHQAGQIMQQRAAIYADQPLDSDHRDCLNQMGRELLLAQSSDWPFIIKTQTTVEYATSRIHDHLTSFFKLADQLRHDSIDVSFLKARIHQYSIFPNLDFHSFI
ncbi:MAG: DUF1957 domain-containing protein [Candidatus Delongbacteria bacterium]|nr:DUF1957 domain-containing protein [Candidatus Delongbacteria bacterium]